MHTTQAYAKKVSLGLLETTDLAPRVIPGETRNQDVPKNIQISVSNLLSYLNTLLNIMKEIFNNINKDWDFQRNLREVTS